MHTSLSNYIYIYTCVYVCIYIYIYIYIYIVRGLPFERGKFTPLKQESARVEPANFLSLATSSLATTFYGFPIVAEQERTRKSWASRVKHPMFRLSQDATT